MVPNFGMAPPEIALEMYYEYQERRREAELIRQALEEGQEPLEKAEEAQKKEVEDFEVPF